MAWNLDRKKHQSTDGDSVLSWSEKTQDNTANYFEIIALSKGSTRRLPQNEAVRIDIEPFVQETRPLAKFWWMMMLINQVS